MSNAKALRICLLISLLINAIFLFRAYLNPSASNVDHHSPEVSKVKVSANHTSLEQRMIIFVGGIPRSGTTLVRAMLDAHPDVRCGEETRVIPRIISMRSRWDQMGREHQRLIEAGMGGDLLDHATRAFISEIILRHGSPAKYLCNKDPLVLNYMKDILRLYPKAKFILMIRDGRAVAYSIVSRNVTISGVNSKDYMSAAKFWNKVITRMLRDCDIVGKRYCMKVHYENLVRNPKEWMEKILNYLTVPWHENVLHHHQFINKGISLSK